MTPFQAKKRRQIARTPYSYSAREILKDRFQQASDRDRCVDMCVLGGMGLQGKGEILDCAQERKEISPFPCSSTVEAWRGRSWFAEAPVVRTEEGMGLPMWKWLRMKFAVGCRTMATGSGGPRLRV